VVRKPLLSPRPDCQVARDTGEALGHRGALALVMESGCPSSCRLMAGGGSARLGNVG